MSNYISHGELGIAKPLYDLVNDEVCPNTGVEPATFWTELERIIKDFAPRIQAHLTTRDDLQKKIDSWHRENKSADVASFKKHLTDIGYLEPAEPAFSVDTANVDPEIATIAGAQLVVPLDNARFVLNAANARWGSLYDALYGTDAIPETDGATRAGGYNPIRGAKVVAYTRSFLDEHFPLANGSHVDATGYTVDNGQLHITLDKSSTTLSDADQFKGYSGNADAPQTVLLGKNNLHAELRFDASHPIGKTDTANLCDVILESAITTIMDCEDSVASVDVDDKVQVYRNWLGLMTGTLAHSFKKDGRTIDRELNADRTYTAPDGSALSLAGRSVLLVRNVGSQLEIDAVTYQGKAVPETLIDVMVLSLIHISEPTRPY